MCRICALTNTDHSPIFRPLLMHTMMLSANADSVPQRDGWGVTDGNYLCKAEGSFRNYLHSSWMENMETRHMWLGHVRNASTGTSTTKEASHPYRFKHFVGVHNGNFGGTWREMPNGTVPDSINTDSWRAFYILDMMLEQGKFLPSIVDEWVSRFDDDSAFVVMLLHNQQLHIIRGPKTRDMYYGEHGNGFIFHTDATVLKTTHDWANWYTGEGIVDIQEFPELHYARLDPGTQEFAELRKLDYTPHKITRSFTQSSYAAPAAQTAADRQKDGSWRRVTTITEADPQQIQKLVEWSRLWQMLYPMRQTLAFWYVGRIVRKEVQNYKTPESLGDIMFMDMDVVKEYLKEHPITDVQRKRINEWNNAVHEEHEGFVLDSLFEDDSAPFWELKNAEAIIKELGVE